MFEYRIETSQETKPEGAAVRLIISGSATIDFADRFKAAILEAMTLADSVVVEVSQLLEIDVAGLQLLCSAHRSASLREKTFSLGCESSAALSALAAEIGFLQSLPPSCSQRAAQSRRQGCSEDFGRRAAS